MCRTSLLAIVPAVLLGVGLQAQAGEREAAATLDAVRSDAAALRQFLQRFPKGGDLHNHLDGAIYAENYLEWAAADGKCIEIAARRVIAPPCDPGAGTVPATAALADADTRNALIDAWSTRNFERRPRSGHNQFFSTFMLFAGAGTGREGDMLAEATSRAAQQNILYLELMQSYGMAEARRIARDNGSNRFGAVTPALYDDPEIHELVQRVIGETDAVEARRRELQRCESEFAEAACEVEVRYLAQVIRTFPRDQVLAQTLLAFLLIERDPRYVGLNFVAPEDDAVSLRDYAWHMQIIGELGRRFPRAANGVTLHAGELSLGLVAPEHLGWHIRRAIEQAGARRIGHGIDVRYDSDLPQLLATMRERGIAVEINLTSNANILGVAGDEHPFATYRRYGVPLTLSTDDEGVSRIDLTHEYARALATYALRYGDIKTLSRNALQYSFLAGESLFDDPTAYRRVRQCSRDRPGGERPLSASCAKFLEDNEKAGLQWVLERNLANFEADTAWFERLRRGLR